MANASTGSGVLRSLANVWRLGVKELWSLWRDPAMLVLIAFTFTVSVYTSGASMPETLHMAPISIVDEDDSALSARIASAFHPPHFTHPARIALGEVDRELDAGRTTFVLTIPPGFQGDVLAGRAPQAQLNVDATRMSQALGGAGAIQQIVMGEVTEFLQRHRGSAVPPVDLALRARFNPAMDPSWFGSLMRIVSDVSMLSIILAGAALIREREHGTVEHLLVMPVTPAEIMLGKVWAMVLVVLAATGLSLRFVVQGALQVPIEGSVALFLAGTALHLFATTSMGIFMATLARSMPQFGLLMMLTMMPLDMLSGGMTPRESMPEFVQVVMLAAPTTHYTELSQAILFRGAGFETVWSSLLWLAAIGGLLFSFSLARFRRTLGRMA